MRVAIASLGRVATVAVLALLVGALAAPPAKAGGSLRILRAHLLPDSDPGSLASGELGGPVFAGESVAWVHAAPRGYDVTVTGSSGASVRNVGGLHAGGPKQRHAYLSLAASATRIAFNLSVAHYVPGFDGDEHGVLTAPLGKPLSDYGPCGTNSISNASVGVTGDVVANSDDCAFGIVVHDFSLPRETSWRTFQAYNVPVVIAGRYIALDECFGPVGESACERLVVYDWHSGEEIFREIPGRAGYLGSWDLQPDGKLVFFHPSPGGAEIAWASPNDPSPHIVHSPLRNEILEDVRIAKDRISYIRSGVGKGCTEVAGSGPDCYAVIDLTGHELAAAPRPQNVGLGDYDFDGSRMTWAAQPCEVTAIVTWDLSGPPPRMPSGLCPLPRVRKAVARLGGRRLRVTLVCPRTRDLGCLGTAEVFAPVGFHVFGTRRYALGPGRRKTLRFGLSRSQACRLASSRWRRAVVRVTADTRRRARPSTRDARPILKRTGHPAGCRTGRA